MIQPSLGETESVKAEVVEYNGYAMEKRTMRLSMDKIREIIDAKGKEKIDLLEKYGLISDDLDNLNRTSFAFFGNILHMPFILTSFCKINAVYVLGGDYRIGLPITGIKKLFGSSMFSYDFANAAWGALGVVEVKGLLRSHTMVMVPSFMTNIGFVGVHIHIPMLLDIYHGYSAFTFAIGFGMKSVTFNVLGFFVIGIIIGMAIMGMMPQQSNP
ncbi:MAG: hypothetical protein J7K12_05305 [Thermoplasmata archaeon]|nr:hypothetical protein [Thermoplasmata archaeon]